MSAGRLAEIRARADAARQAAASGTTGLPPNVDGLSISEALDIFAESAEDVPYLLDRLDRAEAALARVRKLHQPVEIEPSVDELARVIGSVHKRETETYGQYDRRRARGVLALLTGDESDE